MEFLPVSRIEDVLAAAIPRMAAEIVAPKA
jgi:hypothetical protein